MVIAAYADVPIGDAGHLLTDYAGRHRVGLAHTARALVDRSMEPAVILDARA